MNKHEGTVHWLDGLDAEMRRVLMLKDNSESLKRAGDRVKDIQAEGCILSPSDVKEIVRQEMEGK